MPATYRFSFGPWNLHEGADPFGPPVRPARDFADKLAIAKRLGFQALQFHDDDVVPADAPAAEMERGTREIRRMLEDNGLEAEFIAPRLWEDSRTIDGAVTSNSAGDRQYALDLARQRAGSAKQAERLERRLLSKAEHILGQAGNWRAVERMAAELLRLGEISGRAARHLFEECLRIED